jgi:hypothetical protein
MVCFNTTGEIKKRFTNQFRGMEPMLVTSRGRVPEAREQARRHQRGQSRCFTQWRLSPHCPAVCLPPVWRRGCHYQRRQSHREAQRRKAGDPSVRYRLPRRKSETLARGRRNLPHVWPSAGFRFVEGKSVTVGRYGRRVTPVYSVMREVNFDSPNRTVYLWSPARASVDRDYHRIWGWVKRNAPSATSWGRGGAYQAGGETICKAPSRFGRTLPFRRESGSGGHEAEILAGDDPKGEMRTQSQNHNNLPGSLTEQHTRSQQKPHPPPATGVGWGNTSRSIR